MKQTSTSKEVIKNIEVETTVKSTDELSNENKEVSKKVNRKIKKSGMIITIKIKPPLKLR